MLIVLKQYGERSFKISVLILVLFSIVCTRIPLLNYLGFELSALTVLIAGLLSGIVVLSSWKRRLPESKKDVLRFIGESLSSQFILSLIPLIISLSNALFVRNCSIGGGVLLYTLIVFPGVLFSLSLALVICTVFIKWHKSSFVVIYLLFLLHIPLVTFFRPQVFAFNPIIGFFPGFTYDETLQVIQRLLIYRIATVAASVCIFAVVLWIWHMRFVKKDTSGRSRQSMPIAEIGLFALLCPALVIVFLFSDRLGLSSSEDYIRQKLAGNYKTAHFDIVYPAAMVKREHAERLGRLHEFYFDKLVRELKINPAETITSFIYTSPEQKGRLTGASCTDISKPWLRQIHTNFDDVEYSLKHEMVHVLAADFGWSPLKIAPNSGLVEGLAVAMERKAAEETLDRAAALVIAAGNDPDIEPLFNAGFYKTNAGSGYTLAGSFCRFLIDSFGVDKLKELYRSGNFDEIYRKDLRSLSVMWRGSFTGIQLAPADSLKGRYFFRRRTIFQKECARVIANLNADTREFLQQKNFEKALLSAQKSLSLSRTPEAVSQKTTALFELRRFKDVIGFTEEFLSDTNIGYSLLPLYIRLGDAYWGADSIAQAKKIYEKIALIHLAPWYEEACVLRLASLQNAKDRMELRNYFIYSLDDTVRISRLELTNTSTARYLLAREYEAKERYAESAQLLETVVSVSGELEYFRLKRLGKAWLILKEYEKAKDVFVRLLFAAPDKYSQNEAREWIEQSVFYAAGPN